MIPDLETSDVKLKGLPTKVHRDPFHQHLILRENRVATVAGFAVASTTPNLFYAVVRQAHVLELAPDEKTERFLVQELTVSGTALSAFKLPHSKATVGQLSTCRYAGSSEWRVHSLWRVKHSLLGLMRLARALKKGELDL